MLSDLMFLMILGIVPHDAACSVMFDSAIGVMTFGFRADVFTIGVMVVMNFFDDPAVFVIDRLVLEV